MNLSMLATSLTGEIAITPTRSFNLMYIIVDTVFLCVLVGLLIWKKRYSTIIFALFGGVLYTIVDYGYFYLIAHAREIYINGELADAGGTFGVLLWMSMSYGMTNFIFMWVCMSRDKLMKYWIFLIVMWWMICPSVCEIGGEATIKTYRTTGQYHCWMAIIMVVEYTILTVLLMRKDKKEFTNVLILCLIGFCVQFGWEFALLINGIRPIDEASIKTLIINSCLETNGFMPTTFAVFYFWTKHFNEDMTRKKLPEPAEATEAPVEETAAEITEE